VLVSLRPPPTDDLTVDALITSTPNMRHAGSVHAARNQVLSRPSKRRQLDTAENSSGRYLLADEIPETTLSRIVIDEPPAAIHQSFLTVVTLNGSWYELTCKFCGTNKVLGKTSFFASSTSFFQHTRRSHRNDLDHEVIQANILEYCNARALSTTDVRLLSNGNDALDHPIVLRSWEKSPWGTSEAHP